MAIRGIEHIGITVPDIRAAEHFFEEAFGATVLYRQFRPEGPHMAGADMNPVNGVDPQVTVRGLTMMRLGDGPNVELFEFDRTEGEAPLPANGMGMTHFAVTVDDLFEAVERFTAAGGTLIGDSHTELGNQETGEGNINWFGTTPFGLLVEIMQFRSPLNYDEGATETRWFPGED